MYSQRLYALNGSLEFLFTTLMDFFKAFSTEYQFYLTHCLIQIVKAIFDRYKINS